MPHNYDILIGVGKKYYPDPSFFIEEVLRLGLSKRVAQLPVFNKDTRLWLVHWGTWKIFGFIKNIKLRILAPEDSNECKLAKAIYGEENVICAPFGALPGDTDERGCGILRESGKYVKG